MPLRLKATQNAKASSKNATSMLDRLPPAYLRIAERAYRRKFTSDGDLIAALDSPTFPKRAEFLTIMTNTLGYEFTSPLEVFRLASGERLAEFERLSPPPGAPSPLEVAGKAFGRTFATPKDLCDFIDQVPTRDMTLTAPCKSRTSFSHKCDPAETRIENAERVSALIHLSFF